jgi:hypothetical protein
MAIFPFEKAILVATNHSLRHYVNDVDIVDL